ncbi:MAG: hypothetical protein KA716_31895 [Gloeotrichia echinulata DEX184]|nr:hypothetical protein [Gloeotrichia echinulata DEX184]MCM0594539.1 hypothetical protein [Gloeotrichia echinulata DEX184]
MAEPTLQQVFGAGASQTATTLTITKSDLLRLTESASNTAEQLLSAILITAQQHLTQANFDANIDQSLVIAGGYTSNPVRGTNNTQYRSDQLTVTLSKVDTQTTIEPDDY